MFKLFVLLLLASCGSERVCYEEYDYIWNGYSYSEHKIVVCEEN